MEYKYCPRCGNKLNLSENEIPMCPRGHFVQNQSGAVVGIIIINDCILLEQRSGITHYGQWALPGGVAELGESPEETLCREVFEETGLVVNSGKLLGVKGTPNSFLVFFEAILIGGELQASKESIQVKWIPIDKLPWDELAFSKQREMLEQYFNDRKGDSYATTKTYRISSRNCT